MSFFSKAGNFALNTITGNQSVTGLGFTPKVILFVTTPDTADITADVANYHMSFGMATATEQGFIATSSVNGQDISDTSRAISVADIGRIFDTPGSTTIDYEISFVSMNADGFTINVDDAPGVAYKVGYLALGGSDLTNATIGQFTPTTSLGSKSVTGLGFQPTSLIVATVNAAIGSNTESSFALGFTDGTNSDSIGNRDTDGQGTSSTLSESGLVLLEADSSATAGNARRLVFTSFDAGGFTYNQTIGPTTSRPILYLAMKGVSVAAGFKQLPTAVGVATVTGLTFQPSAGMFTSVCTSTIDASSTVTARYTIGFATTALQQYSVGGLALNAQGTSSTSHTSHSSFVHRTISAFGAIDETADFNSWSLSGFELGVDLARAVNPSYIHYLVFGATASGGGGSAGGGSSSGGAAGTLGGFGNEF